MVFSSLPSGSVEMDLFFSVDAFLLAKAAQTARPTCLERYGIIFVWQHSPFVYWNVIFFPKMMIMFERGDVFARIGTFPSLYYLRNLNPMLCLPFTATMLWLCICSQNVQKNSPDFLSHTGTQMLLQ